MVGAAVMDLNMAVRRLPRPGETLVDGRHYAAPGGKGANQAVAAARAGAKVEWLGCVGNDPWGERILTELRTAGVDVSRAQVAGDVTTSVAVILVGGGENLIAVDLGANRLVRPEVVAAGPEHCALLLQMELEPRVNEAAIASARARGIPVILNPAPARSLAGVDPNAIAWLTPNELESEQLTSEEIPEAAASNLHERGFGGVVITLGARGALVSVAGSGPVRVDAPAVGRVLDTVGAGDTFNGYFAAGIVAGMDPVAATERAVRAASLSVTRLGAIPAIPHLSELA